LGLEQEATKLQMTVTVQVEIEQSDEDSFPYWVQQARNIYDAVRDILGDTFDNVSPGEEHPHIGLTSAMSQEQIERLTEFAIDSGQSFDTHGPEGGITMFSSGDPTGG
jgi:hypothetical protein